MKSNSTPIAVDLLHFDLENPRLVEFGITKDNSDDEILQILWLNMGIEELVYSIAASGFFTNEPLLAVKEKSSKGKEQIIVIEGNRRLAAVKAILRKDKLKGVSFSDNIKISPGIKKEIQTLPVILLSKREDAWRYIGFKHVNGPLKWGSYAKAEYIAQVHNTFKIPLNEIAIQIGDTEKITQKLYQALMVLQQAEKAKVFDRKDIKSSRLFFSHLYTGIGYEGIKDHLGLKDSTEENPNPIPKAKLNNAGELLQWMYGSKKYNVDIAVRSQNPDLRRLDASLKNKESLAALRAGKPLEVSYEISQPDTEKFFQSLNEAKWAIQKAQSYISTAYKGEEDLLRTAGTISKMAGDLYGSMELIKEKTSQKTVKKRLTEE